MNNALIQNIKEQQKEEGQLTSKRWYAIYTKYKAEKYVVDNLLKKGVEAYIPLRRITKRYVRKVKHYEIPLLNCYVFVRIDLTDVAKVLDSEYVFKFIKSGDTLNPIKEDEIQMLKRVTGDEYKNVSLKPLDWKKGRRAEIVVGNLIGMKGVIIDKKGKKTFVLALESMGLDLEIEVDESYLALIN